MALYIQLQTSFWTHRKTLRLSVALKEAAFWLPPRLWCYAAQNQPDGDFSGYTAEELGMLLGYNGDACSMLEALQKSGFMDEMQVHGWEEHARYHQVYADRAKKAADARWARGQEKKGSEKRRTERRGEEQASPKHARSMLEASALRIYEAYPRKTAKIDALKAIRKALSSTDEETLITATQKFSLAWATADPSERQFIPFPATWFNRGMYTDDPASWIRSSKNGNGHLSAGARMKEERSRGLFPSNSNPQTLIVTDE